MKHNWSNLDKLSQINDKLFAIICRVFSTELFPTFSIIIYHIKESYFDDDDVDWKFWRRPVRETEPPPVWVRLGLFPTLSAKI